MKDKTSLLTETQSVTNFSCDLKKLKTSTTTTRRKRVNKNINPTPDAKKTLDILDAGMTKGTSCNKDDRKLFYTTHYNPQSTCRNIASTMTNIPYNNNGMYPYYYTPEVPYYVPRYCPPNHNLSTPPIYFQSNNFRHTGEQIFNAVTPLQSPDRWKTESQIKSSCDNSDTEEKNEKQIALTNDDKFVIATKHIKTEDFLVKTGKTNAVDRSDQAAILDEYTLGGIVSTPPRIEGEQDDDLWHGNGFEGDFDDLSVSIDGDIDDIFQGNKARDNSNAVDVKLVMRNDAKETKKCSFTEADISSLCGGLNEPDDEEFEELFDLGNSAFGATVAL